MKNQISLLVNIFYSAAGRGYSIEFVERKNRQNLYSLCFRAEADPLHAWTLCL